MKFKRRESGVSAEPDMTPMIDVTFQLISFFMFVLNFSDAEMDERIRLPQSQLAKPPIASVEPPITLQLTKDGTVLIAGDMVPVDQIKPYLQREIVVMEKSGHKQGKTNTTIIIRADAVVPTGKVQALIRTCQDVGFEKFSLRAKNPGG